MKSDPSFPSRDFVLQNEAARELYFNYAAAMPVIDFHNHLSPADVATNRQFENLTTLWLHGDHYKWRAMRTAGTDERLVTGDASDREKFDAWAAVVPQTLRNPLYQWTHMELQRPLGINDRRLDSATASSIWHEVNSRLPSPELRTHGLLSEWNVKLICTTDDPSDDLAHHTSHAASRPSTVMVPAFRPDRLFAFDNPDEWNAWVDRLSAASSISIRDLPTLLRALDTRCDFFHAHGGRLSDHGLEFISPTCCDDETADKLIASARNGGRLDVLAVPSLVTFLLVQLGRMYHARRWTQQFHLGALRNVNSRQLRSFGRDAGCDTIGDFSQARGLAVLLDLLDRDDRLPRTIVYNLNPSDNDVTAAALGSFQRGPIQGKLQYGSAWWFLDQMDGIEKQLNTLSNLSLLSRFVGMVTDSRSFLSFSRHEYFRRVLCNLLGSDIEQGAIPTDYRLIGGMIQDICYRNARNYFGFDSVDQAGNGS